jgi:hypothetical protein
VALASSQRPSASTDLVGGAAHVSPFYWDQFFVAGVVSGSLPRAWAAPAGYGDFIAGVFAIIATVALAEMAAWAILAAWIFNVWGAADLLFAFYKGARVRLEPGSLGAAFYIVTAVVPPLLVSHALIFALLLRASV